MTGYASRDKRRHELKKGCEYNIDKNWKVADDPGYPCRDCDRIVTDTCICERWRRWFCGQDCVGIDGRREKIADGAWARVCAPFRELLKGRK